VASRGEDNDEALAALTTGKANAVGGTSWLWSPEKAFESVDVLFIDEAGQMSLADVLAVSQAAKSWFRWAIHSNWNARRRGSHPDGAEKSALEHLLNGRKTIEAGMGFLLPETWRLHPKVCRYTSDFFYDERLSPHAISQSRIIEGHPWVNGADCGLFRLCMKGTGIRALKKWRPWRGS
jgi:uncharacterized protein